MSYRRTKARLEFEAQVKASIRECRPLYKVGVIRGGGAGSRLLGAYYVLAFAQLEVYVKRLVEDSLGAVSGAPAAFANWPDTMMAYLLHKSDGLSSEYRRYGISEDENAILTKIAQSARKIAIWSGGGALPVTIEPSVFLDRKKYPSPANLPQLFRRLGVNQIWAIVSRAGRMNSELILTSLNDLRTGIAHEGKLPQSFGFSDFIGKVNQMRRFVAALDRAVSSHFCSSMMARKAWNNAMA